MRIQSESRQRRAAASNSAGESHGESNAQDVLLLVVLGSTCTTSVRCMVYDIRLIEACGSLLVFSIYHMWPHSHDTHRRTLHFLNFKFLEDLL